MQVCILRLTCFISNSLIWSGEVLAMASIEIFLFLANLSSDQGPLAERFPSLLSLVELPSDSATGLASRIKRSDLIPAIHDRILVSVDFDRRWGKETVGFLLLAEVSSWRKSLTHPHLAELELSLRELAVVVGVSAADLSTNKKIYEHRSSSYCILGMA